MDRHGQKESFLLISSIEIFQGRRSFHPAD
jgi:hypothetical protein